VSEIVRQSSPHSSDNPLREEQPTPCATETNDNRNADLVGDAEAATESESCLADENSDKHSDADSDSRDSGYFTGGGGQATGEGPASMARADRPQTDVRSHRDEDEDDDFDPDVVILGREKGETVAKSAVDDYIYRPSCYESLSLVKWVQLSTQRRIPRKKRKAADDEEPLSDREDNYWEDVHEEPEDDKRDWKEFRKFKEVHPLHDTHEVNVDTTKETYVIPNYLGGKLPRRDERDREYYCMAMMTLFKPWRCAADLKPEDNTWDEVFIAHPFSCEQEKIMANFHLRYECLDDRDNYHRMIEKESAKNRKAKKDGWFSTRDDDDNVDERETSDTDYTEMASKIREDLAHDRVGTEYKRKQAQMDEVERIMRRTGWVKGHLDESRGEATEELGGLAKAVSGLADSTATAWRSVLKSAKVSILAEKRKNMQIGEPRNSYERKHDHDRSSDSPELARVLSSDFVNKDYKAREKKIEKLIDSTALSRNLNKEQDGAFRIVANHASGKDFKQLRMYLGGMGGTGKSQVIKSIIDMFNARNEKHRFIVLAPTGTAAALLQGSTYHSALGL
jgi:PIF1-like helicase